MEHGPGLVEHGPEAWSMVPDLFREGEEAGVVNPIGSRIAGCLLMTCLHQGDGADDGLKFKRPPGPEGPVYAFGLWCVPFLGSACGMPRCAQHRNTPMPSMHRLLSFLLLLFLCPNRSLKQEGSLAFVF